jgi:hypothetical protein
MLEAPFPKSFLIMVGLEYLDHHNGFPKIGKGSLYPGEFIITRGDSEMLLAEGGGGTSLFILLDMPYNTL